MNLGRRLLPSQCDVMTEKYLAPVALAQRWQLSTRTLERLRKSGKGPRFFRVGRAVRYCLDDIAAFEREQEAGQDA